MRKSLYLSIDGSVLLKRGVTLVRGCPYSSVCWNDSSSRKKKVAGHALPHVVDGQTAVQQKCTEKKNKRRRKRRRRRSNKKIVETCLRPIVRARRRGARGYGQPVSSVLVRVARSAGSQSAGDPLDSSSSPTAAKRASTCTATRSFMFNR